MTREERILRGMRVVRLGHGANCSSIGSVVDTLFASAAVGGAVFAAIAAAMAHERIRTLPAPGPDPGPDPAPAPDPDPAPDPSPPPPR